MSNQYVELKRRHEAEVNALPMKFAFSRKQLEQIMSEWGLTLGVDNDKLYSIGFGGYILKTDSDLVQETFQRHKNELAAAIEADETGDKYDIDHIHSIIILHYHGGIDYEETKRKENHNKVY